jgi:hypothetical protein
MTADELTYEIWLRNRHQLLLEQRKQDRFCRHTKSGTRKHFGWARHAANRYFEPDETAMTQGVGDKDDNE